MEWCGKYWCISVDELTRDDRTPSDMSDILSPIVSRDNYHKMCQRGRIKVVRQGKGKGSYALVDMDSLPEDLRTRVLAKYPDADERKAHLHKVFAEAYVYDRAAQQYYVRTLTRLNQSLSNARVYDLAEEYAINASVIQAILRLKQNTRLYRRVRNGRMVSWADMADAITYYRDTYGHTLGITPSRFATRVRAWESKGYDALISRKFGNNNRLKVSIDVEQLLMQLESDPHRPTDKKVWDWYNAFLRGDLKVINQYTGEIYNPDNYPDLSEKTVGDVLGKVINRAVSSKRHDDRHTYMTNIRPHTDREKPRYSLSMVSMDDKDFSVNIEWYKIEEEMSRGRKIQKRKKIVTALKCYAVFDVASEVMIGWAWSGTKERDIFEECLRSMYRNLISWGLGQPYEAQVENHLVGLYRDTMMADGALFPTVRWCGKENSQEKYAERYFEEVKLRYEKYAFLNVGRHYARSASNRTSNKKSFDEENVNYQQDVWKLSKAIETYEREVIDRYNNDPHPNSKLYPNMTRMQVLLSCAHAQIQPVDEVQLSRWLGGSVATSINRSQFQAANRTFHLSSHLILDKLRGRNTKVRATWWEQEEGEISQVYLWQDDRLIDVCQEAKTFQVSKLETSEEDRKAFGHQMQRLAEWDRIISERKPDPILKLSEEQSDAIDHKPLRVVSMPLEGELIEEVDEEIAVPHAIIGRKQSAAARGAADI